MAEFRMPSLGADMEAGTLVEWLKQPGEEVERGEVIAVVETQKGAIEIEVFESGRLAELLVKEGATVPVGTPIAVIDGAAPEAVPEAAQAAPPPPEAERAAPAAPPAPRVAPAPAEAPEARAAPAPPSAPSAGRVQASPAARRLAAERGLSLEGLTGSGPGGAILSTDLPEAEAEAPAAAKTRGLDLGEMRKAIAAAMARAKREIPHYYLSHAVDLAAAESWLAAANAERAPAERLLMGALFLKASARALRRYGEFNGFYEEGRFAPSERIHVGLAVAIRGGGLIAPAVHDADKLSLDEAMARMRELVQRVRQGRLRSSELTDPTVTLSSLGERGVDSLYAVIYPPQVAILGFGTPARGATVVDDRVEVRPGVTVTLAADHRVSDGHRGALLLREIDRLLQTPEAL